MGKSVLFSIIIPTYNSQNYIRDSVQSVIQQSFSNWEVIIVDDGSTDNTIESIKPLLTNKIKLITKQHSGPLISRYTGATLSKGEYLLFLDSDDLFHPKTLEILSNNLEMLTFFKLEKFNDITQLSFKDIQTHNIHRKIINISNYNFSENYLICCCVKKEIFKGAIESIPPKLSRYHFSEDLLACCIMASMVDKISFLDCSLTMYRRSNLQSITHNLTYKEIFERFIIVDYLYQHLYKDGFNEKDYFGFRHVYTPFVWVIKSNIPYKSRIEDYDFIRNSFSFKLQKKFKKSKTVSTIFFLIQLRFYKLLFAFIKHQVKHKKI